MLWEPPQQLYELQCWLLRRVMILLFNGEHCCRVILLFFLLYIFAFLLAIKRTLAFIVGISNLQQISNPVLFLCQGKALSTCPLWGFPGDLLATTFPLHNIWNFIKIIWNILGSNKQHSLKYLFSKITTLKLAKPNIIIKNVAQQ